MERTIKLVANIGGEEGPGRKMPKPAKRAAKLWSLIFPEESQVIEPQFLDRSLLSGYKFDKSAFSFLDQEIAWAWINTSEAESLASPIRLGGCTSQTVRKVHDKAFLHGTSDRRFSEPRDLGDITQILEPRQVNFGQLHERFKKCADSLPTWQGGFLRMKPRFGSTGRKHLVFHPCKISTNDLSKVILNSNSGVIIEPELERVHDYSLQAYIDPSGKIEILGILKQHVDRTGKFQGHSGVIDENGHVSVQDKFIPEIKEVGIKIFERAIAQGYHGPCGIDSFTYRGPNGHVLLRPAVEFNARFTMGTVTIGILRRTLVSKVKNISGGGKKFHFTASYSSNLVGLEANKTNIAGSEFSLSFES